MTNCHNNKLNNNTAQNKTKHGI
ncbi:hypothetical protein LLL26_004718 [Salmonella enterica]|nr:hypothetical protein [Salmonella enterica]